MRLRLVRHACAVLGQAANPRARVIAARILLEMDRQNLEEEARGQGHPPRPGAR
jgi:hypothetical protein